MIRIVFTGSESTGKTTLASAVAKRYGVEVVPEFVRTFAEARGGLIEFSDHGAIARGQMALEDEYIAQWAGRAGQAGEAGVSLLIQDTDLLSTVVYCRHYFGRCPAWIEDEAWERRPDLYLLCDIDVPWVADGVRDRGHMRDEMQELFEKAVNGSQAASAIISGSPEARLAQSIAIIDQLMNTGSRR